MHGIRKPPERLFLRGTVMEGLAPGHDDHRIFGRSEFQIPGFNELPKVLLRLAVNPRLQMVPFNFMPSLGVTPKVMCKAHEVGISNAEKQDETFSCRSVPETTHICSFSA